MQNSGNLKSHFKYLPKYPELYEYCNPVKPYNDEQQRKSVLYIRIILKKFCSLFLQEACGLFFKSVKDLLQRKSLDDDETCFFYWLVQFFTEFTRNSEFDEQTKLDLIKETFSLELFHSIEVFIQRCFEMMRVDKENNKLWAKRMHTSLKCYKENLSQSQVESAKLASVDTNINLDDDDQLADLADKMASTDTSEP
ncbi:timeless -like protein, partial [Brachionus plicatilis]